MAQTQSKIALEQFADFQEELKSFRRVAEDCRDYCETQKLERGPALHTWTSRHSFFRRVVAQLRTIETDIEREFS